MFITTPPEGIRGNKIQVSSKNIRKIRENLKRKKIRQKQPPEPVDRAPRLPDPVSFTALHPDSSKPTTAISEPLTKHKADHQPLHSDRIRTG